ncbi:hypothetical protein GCM10027036_33980 [Flavihumibacter cheonanensis]|uniref:methyltransferase family protein n=1 Tax=Flavihumibacter cheonanensis TaxID=1442385 RepID=UPI001EF7DE7D|nr:methyltransferase [Flavihumibacter cheonanensis]MCG7752571.1 hypothetical protein [Flavihumibacter cheonanensis]
MTRKDTTPFLRKQVLTATSLQSFISYNHMAYSRNPIFLGMLFSVFGLFLVLPNLITFFVSCCSYIVIQIQIRLEEEFLGRQHGEAYTRYKERVRRLI